MIEAIFSIYRFDPSTDEEPHYKKYCVAIDEKTTIMNVLNKIKDKSDGTLSFRKGCGAAICGTCAVRVNGVAKLACKTKVMELLTAIMEKPEITIEPLASTKVIKDLVIDQDEFWTQLNNTMPWLVSNTPKNNEEHEVAEESIALFDKSQDCINCHACSSDCSVYASERKFLGPEALVKIYRYVADSRDVKKEERLKLATENGMWNCAHAYNCSDVCPKDVKPADKITKLRELAVQSGLDNNRGARHAKNFIDSLNNVGKLEEVKMPLKTLRPWGVHAFIPDTMKMVAHGKMPPIIQRKIKDHEQVKTLLRIAKQRRNPE
jgi:succinate dehydrogenase / fumarate reductase iron-sulfur subunit